MIILPTEILSIFTMSLTDIIFGRIKICSIMIFSVVVDSCGLEYGMNQNIKYVIEMNINIINTSGSLS